MPWLETNPVLERRHFVHDIESGHWSRSELCLRYGIGRNTGYKGLDRYRQSGGSGLHDHSRAPHMSPNRTPDEFVELILEENGRYGWGAREILRRLQIRFPNRDLPARSTVFDLSLLQAFTVSRILTCGGFSSESLIRASRPAIHSKTALTNACIERSRPGPPNPQVPTQASSSECSNAFEKPATTFGLTKHSTMKRPLRDGNLQLALHPEGIAPPEYPPHLEVRRVSNCGTFRLHSTQQFLSQALKGEFVGLEQVDDGIWNILYYDTLLGRYDEPNTPITGARALREKCQLCPRTIC